jgi:hypothetical protein
MKNLIAIIVVPLLFASCVPSYAPPKSGEATAEISFEGGHPAMFTDGESCSNPQVIPTENLPINGKSTPLKIRANKEIAFIGGFSSVENVNQKEVTFLHCVVAYSFIPAEHQKYKFLVVVKGNTCGGGILKLSPNGQYETELAATKREFNLYPSPGSQVRCSPKQI